MSKAVLLSSLYELAGDSAGAFESFFRNLAAGFAAGSGRADWTAAVIDRAESACPAAARKSVFEAPESVGAGFRFHLARFKKRLEVELFVKKYAEKLKARANELGGATVVHAHDPFAVLAFRSLGAPGSAAPLCFTPGYLSCLEQAGRALPWLRDAEKKALELADCVIAPGREYLSALEGAYGPLKRARVVLPGLDDAGRLKTGALRRRLGAPESSLFVAAFYGPGTVPDAEFFMEAFAVAAKAAPGRLFGVAHGLQSGALACRLRNMGIGREFSLLGPDSPGGELLAEADIFFSSFRRPSVELGSIAALRAGLAVAAADTGWNAEAAGYGEAALLFRTGDAASAGAALAEIALHPPALIYFSSRAREYFKARYTLAAFAGRAAEVYSGLSGAPAAGTEAA